MSADVHGLLRLQSWLSPAFPTGAFSYSHGLETAIDEGLVSDLDGLRHWLEGALHHGVGRTDAWFVVEAAVATQDRDARRLVEVGELASALCGAAELRHETRVQGQAFLATLKAVWPHERLDWATAVLAEDGIPATLPIAAGLAGAAHGIALERFVPLYLGALVANLVSAGVRLVPLGQTDGQRAVAALEPTVAEVAAHALRRTEAQPGSAALIIDLCAMRHETQYTRLFRS